MCSSAPSVLMLVTWPRMFTIRAYGFSGSSVFHISRIAVSHLLETLETEGHFPGLTRLAPTDACGRQVAIPEVLTGV